MADLSPLLIAIDGPSGAGKGTVARTVAANLGYTHVDTGAMYRAVAWKALRDGLPLDNDSVLAGVAERSAIDVEGGFARIDGQDITQAIRTPEIDTAAATVARLPLVREVLVSRQRAYGPGGVVMEGRDIGTVVFPGAGLKIYLDASTEERARRRAADTAHSGGAAGTAAVAASIADRDRSDSTRAISPLALAPDAVYLDTTDLSIDAVVARVMELVTRALVARG